MSSYTTSNKSPWRKGRERLTDPSKDLCVHILGQNPCQRFQGIMFEAPLSKKKQKGPHIWAWGHFAVAKRPPYMGMGTLCTGKKAPKYGHGDTLHWQKGPHIWAWDTLHWQKGP